MYTLVAYSILFSYLQFDEILRGLIFKERYNSSSNVEATRVRHLSENTLWYVLAHTTQWKYNTRSKNMLTEAVRTCPVCIILLYHNHNDKHVYNKLHNSRHVLRFVVVCFVNIKT